MHTRYRLFYLSIVDTPSGVDAYNIAKQQNIHCVAFSLKFHWCGSMEWNMEENFSMEWIMKWKIFSMEWKKIASMEYGKIVFHSIPCPACI